MEFNQSTLTTLPIIDWDLAMRLAGNKQALAEEILSLFIKMLPDSISLINQTFATKNYRALLQNIHKLHGAICYCGIPRLKTVIAHLETNLKKNIMTDLPSLIDQLNIETTLLLERYSLHATQ